MKQKKKAHHSRPHGDGRTYAERLKTTQQVYIQATRDIYSQYVFDLACIVLHTDFGFGRDRLTRFYNALAKLEHENNDALAGDTESGYKRAKIDCALREIWGDDLVPFEKRYEWVKDTI